MLLNLNKETCIFINSCDKTFDVAEYFLKSFQKYIENNNLKIFMGINDKKHSKKYSFINYISSPKSNWKYETIFQLNIIKKKYNFKNVILILDDFIFHEKTDMYNVYSLINEFEIKKIPYLCLKKMDESLLIHLVNLFKEKKTINKIRNNYPYYTSLQIALWNIDYLLSNVKQSKSIWHFERQQLSKNHYHVSDNLFHYIHIVEKGEWNYGTKRYVEKFVCEFDPGHRKFRGSFFGEIIFNLKKFSFLIFGFMIMRIRKN